MLKQLLSIMTVASVVTVNAQSARKFTPDNSKNLQVSISNSNLKTAALTCSNVQTFIGSSLTIGALTATTGCTTGGYAIGNNCYGDLAKANYFAPTTYSTISSPSVTGVAVLFYSSGAIGTKGTGNVTLNLYPGTQAGGPTGTATPIASNVASLPSIVASPTLGPGIHAYTFTLSTPVSAPAGGFYASIVLPVNPGDTAVLLANAMATTTPNYGWEQQSDNAWYNMALSWGVSFNIAMVPQICGTATVTGLTQNSSLAHNISMMPNPTSGELKVNVNLNETQDLTISVTNAIGQVVMNNNYSAVLSESVNLNLSNQPNGIYFVTVSNGKDKMVQRIVLNK
ncbi:MAG: T9SS type A sorting domain-containing protein [Bacteroidetes bacterium]|nr:T9SS type A sorting domain-containing protein [Bacteroidota bacterium]